MLLTKSAALELGPDIRVNAICPGMIDTPMPHRSVEDHPPEARQAILDSLLETHVARRMGRPEEVVALGVFLASDEASFITGAAIPVRLRRHRCIATRQRSRTTSTSSTLIVAGPSRRSAGDP